ncbi:leucine-rich repeat and immunoglobulin-like domain containing-NOGO receptor-interacting protein 4 [Argopecten irradians]|uniref:leucine-rich repeat and immunoglobulin-like domain containing-NOGO receptor-interacting protein 4 n=1 Tax=Argopecten irradians TaxID=31199 RepID=UPI003723CB21
MAAIILAVVLCVLSVPGGLGQTFPTGCAYDATDASVGVYNCDYTALTSTPITYSSFASPYPQRLRIYKVSGTISSALFSGFSSFTTSNFDTNYVASLEIECVSNTDTTFNAGTFADMGYLQGVTIKNCKLVSIPASAFAEFGSLNYFRIEGGSIAALDTASFTGVNVSKLAVPDPSGDFTIKNCATPGTFPANMLDHLTTTKKFDFNNAALTEITTTTFALNKAVTSIVISNNAITTLTDNVFEGLDGLSSVDMTGLQWGCTCEALWFLEKFSTAGIEIVGGPVCSTPTDYADKRSTNYYSASCTTVDICNGTPGIVMGSSCMTVYQLVSYSVLLVTLVLSCVALGLVCNTRKQLTNNKNKLKNKKNSSWNKVQDALKRGGNTGQKPPAKTNAPKGKGWV